MKPISIVIEAASVVSAYGCGVSTLWQGLNSGRSAIGTVSLLDNPAPTVVAATISDECISKTSSSPLSNPGDDRALTLIERVTEDLLASIDGGELNRDRLGVCVGTTQGRIRTWEREQQRMRDDAAFVPQAPHNFYIAQRVADLVHAGGPVSSPSLACATGASTIGFALDWLRSRRCDAVIAGGVDLLSPFVYSGFAALKALDLRGPSKPFDRDRQGLVLGEAAALMLLRRVDESDCRETDRLNGDRVNVLGFGLAADGYHLTGPDPTGAGLARAIRAVLDDAGIEANAIDAVCLHGTGTRFNDAMEDRAMRTVFGPRSTEIPVTAIKGAVGHTLAAAGVLEAIVCVMALQDNMLPPCVGFRNRDPDIALNIVGEKRCSLPITTMLMTSAGFGGINAALVLSR